MANGIFLSYEKSLPCGPTKVFMVGHKKGRSQAFTESKNTASDLQGHSQLAKGIIIFHFMFKLDLNLGAANKCCIKQQFCLCHEN